METCAGSARTAATRDSAAARGCYARARTNSDQGDEHAGIMRNFTTVKPTYWNGPTGREIRDVGGRDAQLLGLYLLTNPHTNMIGLYYLPHVMIERELALSASEITSALAILTELGFAHYDTTTEMVWVVEMAHHQLGDTPVKLADKRLPTVRRLYASAPVNPFLEPFYDHYQAALRLQERRLGTKSCNFTTSINKGHPDTRKPLYPVPDPVPVLDQSFLEDQKKNVTPLVEAEPQACEPALDGWFRELAERYPEQGRSGGHLTESAFVRVLSEDPRPDADVFTEMLDNLENQKAGYQWRVKRMIPSLLNWLREGKWKQRHDPVPPTAIVSERTLQTEIAGEAFVRGGGHGPR